MNLPKPIHWKAAADGPLAAAITQPALGLISDLDGTLSPIVDVPDEARMSAKNAAALKALAMQGVEIAIISGRGAADLAKRVAFPNATLIGNHGMEEWIDGEARIAQAALNYRPQLVRVADELRQIKAEGVYVEDKGASLALHYRRSQDPETFNTQHMLRFEALAAQYGLAFSSGRMIFEFKAPVNINKGTALQKLIREKELGAAIFMGDDRTDISALQTIQALRSAGAISGFGIGVQSAEGDPAVIAAADYFAEGVEDVAAFLGWLLEARSASST